MVEPADGSQRRGRSGHDRRGGRNAALRRGHAASSSDPVIGQPSSNHRPSPAAASDHASVGAAAISRAWQLRAARVGFLVAAAPAVALAAVRFAGSAAVVSFAFFAVVCVALATIDAVSQVIPNRILYPAAAASAVLLSVAALVDAGTPQAALAAMAAAAAGAASSWLVFHLLWRVSSGIGYGDVRLCAYIGAHVGYVALPLVPLVFVYGFVLATLVGTAVGLAAELRNLRRRRLARGDRDLNSDAGLLAAARRVGKRRFALAPFLVLGALVGLANPLERAVTPAHPVEATPPQALHSLPVPSPA